MNLEQLLKTAQSDVIIMNGIDDVLRLNYSTMEGSIKLLSDDILNREVDSVSARSTSNRFDSACVICVWLKEPEVEEIPDDPIEDTPTEPVDPEPSEPEDETGDSTDPDPEEPVEP